VPSTPIAFILILGQLARIVENETDKVFAVIWTTTPWTLPANRVSFHFIQSDIGHCNQSIHDLSPHHNTTE
jgi:isoleucyl-tRNA synthetase